METKETQLAVLKMWTVVELNCFCLFWKTFSHRQTSVVLIWIRNIFLFLLTRCK